MSEFTISVAQLNDYVAARLGQDPFLHSIWVEGEIEKPAVRRGIAYFALVDDEASVDCMIFRGDLERMQSLIEHGKRVRVHGAASLYPKTGRYRLAVRDVRPVGVGELFLRMVELQRRLAAKGYFAAEKKRSLPPYPKRIAVVTSKEGAALQDILQVAGRRNPGVAIQVYPTLVQGERAPASIACAIRRANRESHADVLIVARGGGSAGDLAAFNDEAVVTAVAESAIPVVSAVGHETDISLCDLAADRRAPTPSAAAEIAVPDRSQILAELDALRSSLRAGFDRVLSRRSAELAAERKALRSLVVTQKLDLARDQLRFFARSGLTQLRHLLDKSRGELRAQRARLEALNPERILQSGYAVVLQDGRRINSAAELHTGEHVELLFADGRRRARIEEIPDGGREEH